MMLKYMPYRHTAYYVPPQPNIHTFYQDGSSSALYTDQGDHAGSFARSAALTPRPGDREYSTMVQNEPWELVHNDPYSPPHSAHSVPPIFTAYTPAPSCVMPVPPTTPVLQPFLANDRPYSPAPYVPPLFTPCTPGPRCVLPVPHSTPVLPPLLPSGRPSPSHLQRLATQFDIAQPSPVRSHVPRVPTDVHSPPTELQLMSMLDGLHLSPPNQPTSIINPPTPHHHFFIQERIDDAAIFGSASRNTCRIFPPAPVYCH
jgi:hypothetical protein